MCGRAWLAISPVEQAFQRRLDHDQDALREREAETLAMMLQQEIVQCAGLSALTDVPIESAGWAQLAEGLWKMYSTGP